MGDVRCSAIRHRTYMVPGRYYTLCSVCKRSCCALPCLCFHMYVCRMVCFHLFLFPIRFTIVFALTSIFSLLPANTGNSCGTTKQTGLLCLSHPAHYGGACLASSSRSSVGSSRIELRLLCSRYQPLSAVDPCFFQLLFCNFTRKFKNSTHVGWVELQLQLLSGFEGTLLPGIIDQIGLVKTGKYIGFRLHRVCVLHSKPFFLPAVDPDLYGPPLC